MIESLMIINPNHFKSSLTKSEEKVQKEKQHKETLKIKSNLEKD
jgi:hypothetical protein